MYCKTTKSHVAMDNAGKLNSWVREKWGPLISRQNGFREYYFASKPEGEFVIIMLWDEETQIQRWSDNPEHKALVPEFVSLTIARIEMDIYRVEGTADAKLDRLQG